MDIKAIQKYLTENEIDGWLLADFHGRNEIAMQMLGITEHLSRRAFFLIPNSGEPVALVNPVEASKFSGLPFRIRPYHGFRELEASLKEILTGCCKAAMEYSDSARMPTVGLVDAGTIELVRSFGVEIVSSADLVANFKARLTQEQIASHRLAARNLIEIKDATFNHISDALKAGNKLTELEVCEFICERFSRYEMVTEFGPNCSVDAHAADGHYDPTPESSFTIEPGSFVLIDLWAKAEFDHAVYGDITWTAFAGTCDEIPEKHKEVFEIVQSARDRAIEFLRDNIGKQPVYGYQVDDACREVIENSGYGRQFVHRTGHSIATSVHGPGPNIDHLETEDKRKLQEGHLFSIEPGIYLPGEFGLRSEIDCLVTQDGVEVTTLPLQNEITPLL